ncbi:hypothetical protein [Ruegeria sp. EL01]|uniref:hypothetical protein n=1 Tax=Ruegeria sp. EL01 TaxID=2107578 RepID=UPI000EA82890|nr:hypothetical protein [Ruegeria sp. EL01]
MGTNNWNDTDIQTLLRLMRSSKQEYEQYLSNGRAFLHARKLRENNQAILDLIAAEGFGSDDTLAAGLQDLKEHLEDWARCWDREQTTQAPKDGDPFVFTGYKTYPKHLDTLLTRYQADMGRKI